jgi:carbon storage regulator
MLVMSRKRDESIMIGDRARVTVVDLRGDKVRLGIQAPKEIPVHRQEVYDAIQRENRKAAAVEGTEKKAVEAVSDSMWWKGKEIEGSMLTLSRKKNESIMINDDIMIVVVEIRGDKVRIGIEAPKEVPVHRQEVYDAIKRGEEKESDGG